MMKVRFFQCTNRRWISRRMYILHSVSARAFSSRAASGSEEDSVWCVKEVKERLGVEASKKSEEWWFQ